MRHDYAYNGFLCAKTALPEKNYFKAFIQNNLITYVFLRCD